MARLLRKNQKVFAGNATNNGIFGSLQSGNPQTTNDIEQLQSLPAYNQGWNAATMSSETLPALEETQALNYINTYQLTYLLQEGIPEYSASTTYYKGSLVKYVNSNGFQILSSKTDDNQGNGVTNQDYWNIEFDSTNPPQLISNMVTNLDDPNETTYPTSQAVKNYVDTALDNFEGDFVTPAQLQAVDESALHKEGDETITGLKTLYVAGNSKLVIKSDIINCEITPSDSLLSDIQFVDINNKPIGELELIQRNTNGNIDVSLIARNRAGSLARVTAGMTPEGTATNWCDTISDAADNSNRIANTKWVNSRINSIMNSKIVGATKILALLASNGTNRLLWGTTGNGTLTFALPFKDTNYSIAFGDTAYHKYDSRYITNKTTTSVTINGASENIQWIAVGLST